MHLIIRVSLNKLVILGDGRDPGAQPSSEVQQQTFVIFQLVLLCWQIPSLSLRWGPPWRANEILNRGL